MSKAKAYLLAARPKTLPAAVCPVIAGSALAWRLSGSFSWLLLWATLLSTIAIQVATNYFNDAVDAAKGADTEARLGPKRATASGLISPRAMLTAGAIAGLIAAALSVPLIVERGWPIVVIGVVSLFFSYGYTGGPWPLAYRGLGEVFVMLFFGFVAVTGTVFVQTGEWRAEGLLLGAQIGALSTVLIAINNLRDIEEDTRSNKRTLAVRFGKRVSRVMITVFLMLPATAGFLWIAMRQPALAGWPLFPFIVPAIVGARKIWTTDPSPIYNKYLAASAAILMLWTLAFTTACLLAES